jgi:predicted nuclease of restriction endonuclease-like RecB superfamily
MRAIKFHGLIHRVERKERGWHRITLDGPLSLFRLSTKYGVKMANFLPALLLGDCWRLEAEVGWEPRQPPSLFRLTAEEGLKSHYRDRGTWISDEEKAFRSKVAEGKEGWRVLEEPRMITLTNGEVLVPDLVLKHEDGREAMVDIVWFWKKGSLERKIESLKHGAPPNLIFAVSDRLKTDEEQIQELPVSVLRFKGVLPTRKILARAEEVGL